MCTEVEGQPHMPARATVSILRLSAPANHSPHGLDACNHSTGVISPAAGLTPPFGHSPHGLDA
jgi:hypothetical protein